jgi:iron complex transport system permease protein
MATEKKTAWIAGFFVIFVLGAAALSLCLGSSVVGVKAVCHALLRGDVTSTAGRIVRYVRLPRTCAALLAGAALAVSGAIIQSVLANPLAAPNIIGVNGGAGFGVALCCALVPGSVVWTPVAAFLGALLGVLLVLWIGQSTGASRLTLILAGVAVSSLFTACVDTVVTFVPDALNGYSDFRIGGFSSVTMAKLGPAAVLIFLGLALALSLAGFMDVLALGDDTAGSLGLSVKWVRLGLLTIAAALAGSAVSFSGLLGFVGLIVPHMVRRVAGDSGHRVIALSALGGAGFVTVCDTVARTVFSPYELPVGIVLAFVGAPFFLWLLRRQKRGREHG